MRRPLLSRGRARAGRAQRERTDRSRAEAGSGGQRASAPGAVTAGRLAACLDRLRVSGGHGHRYRWGMRILGSMLAAAGGVALFAACLGEDPDPVALPDDAGVVDGAVDAGQQTTPPLEPPLTDAASDAASDAPAADAGPTCKEYSNACRDTFVAKVKATCNPARSECQAKPECGASPNPCTLPCKAAFLDCQTVYENECVQCGKEANVCDPSEDCHKSAVSP